jgi:hypothetical protein
VLVGGGMPMRDRKRVVYAFVTATIADTRGEVLSIPEDGELPDQPAK